MAQYIDKSAVVAEIKTRIETYNKGYANGDDCRADALETFLHDIDTLEVKEINNVWNNASDFPKAEAGRSMLLIEDNGHAELLKSPSAERLFYFRSANLKMWAYVDELLSITTHFEVKEMDSTDAFIEKALKFLDEKFYFNNLHHSIESGLFDSEEEMFEDFKNYIKGE